MNKDLEELYLEINTKYIENNVKFPKIKRLIHMNKWNIVFTDNFSVGIAFNFTGEHNIYNQDIDLKQIKKLNKFIDKNIKLFIEYLLDDSDIQSRSFLVASLNALSQNIMDKEYMNKKDFKLLETDEFDFLGKEDTVTLIGYGGVVDKIIDKTDSLIITASTIVNGTYKDIIKKSKNCRIKWIFGPSGQMLPEILFNLSFNYITSNKINNTDKYYKDIINPMNNLIK